MERLRCMMELKLGNGGDRHHVVIEGFISQNPVKVTVVSYHSFTYRSRFGYGKALAGLYPFGAEDILIQWEDVVYPSRNNGCVTVTYDILNNLHEREITIENVTEESFAALNNAYYSALKEFGNLLDSYVVE